MKTALLLILLSFLSIVISAQECFQWKNLKLGQSSLAETVNLLGKPDKDRPDKPGFDKITAREDGERLIFRKLRYKKLDFYREVELLFLNEKLFSLEFKPEPKTILAADLKRRFDIEFLYAGDLSTHIKFSDYQGKTANGVQSVLPAHYNLVSVRRNCAVVAEIDNGSAKTMELFGFKTLPEGMFPGTVKAIRIFNRESKIE
jgi:hypothetical protein